MRVIFADYDGVFHAVSDLRWFTMGLPVDTCIERGRLFRWTSILHEMLDEHPDVRIVVHSGWRLLHTEDRVKSLLGPLAERVVHVISREYDRGEGVAAYIVQNRVEDYVILDDRPDWFAPGTLRLVVCDSETGIYNEHVRAQLLEWLERGNSRVSQGGRKMETAGRLPNISAPSGCSVSKELPVSGMSLGCVIQKYEVQEHIRETLEYDEASGLFLKKDALRFELERINSKSKKQEARGLVLKKAALRTEIRRIKSEIKKLQYLSPDAVMVAQTDVEQSMPGMLDEDADPAESP